MSRTYVLTIRIELDADEARDDVEARHQAMAQYAEQLGSRPIPGVTAKLQEIYPDRPPRSVHFDPTSSEG